MPVIGRSHDDSINLLNIQQAAEVFVLRHLSASSSGSTFHVWFVNVTYGHRIDYRLFQKDRPDLHRAITAGDQAHIDAVVRAQNAHAAKRRPSSRRQRRLRKSSSAYVFHVYFVLLIFSIKVSVDD
jgi:hypothetical protein